MRSSATECWTGTYTQIKSGEGGAGDGGGGIWWEDGVDFRVCVEVLYV